MTHVRLLLDRIAEPRSVATRTGELSENNEQDAVDLANQAATIWVAQFNAPSTIPNDIEFHTQIEELAE